MVTRKKAAAAAKPAKDGVLEEYRSRIKRLQYVQAKSRELFEKFTEIQAEIDEILESGGGTSARVRTLVEEFSAHWKKTYRGDYVWHGAREMGQWKTLLRSLPVEELTHRIANYFRSSDPFYRSRRHPFELFFSKVNEFADAALLPMNDHAFDCRHDPPCATDAEHTRKRTAEYRQ